MVPSVLKVINIKKWTPEESSPLESNAVHCQHWEETQFPIHFKSIRLLWIEPYWHFNLLVINNCNACVIKNLREDTDRGNYTSPIYFMTNYIFLRIIYLNGFRYKKKDTMHVLCVWMPFRIDGDSVN